MEIKQLIYYYHTIKFKNLRFLSAVCSLYLILFILLFCQGVNAQSYLEWGGNIGGESPAHASTLIQDQLGNTIISGTLFNSMDADPGNGNYILSGNGNMDIYLIKLDINGQFVWGHSFGGSEYDLCLDISTDDLGNVYMVGRFRDTVDFDPGPLVHNLTSNGLDDIYIIKLNNQGEYIWSESFGGISYDMAYDICIMDTNLYVTGHFMDSLDFNPGIGSSVFNSNGGSDIFLLKMNTDGEYIWAKTFGGPSTDSGRSIYVNENNSLILSGAFQDSIDIDPGTQTSTLVAVSYYSNTFISKFDTSGTLLWAEVLNGTGHNHPKWCQEDTNNEIVIVGYFRSTVDFNPGPGLCEITSAGEDDIYFVKLDSIGEFKWAHTFGGTGIDVPAKGMLDSGNNIYGTGVVFGQVDFDPGPDTFYSSVFGEWDGFILKLDKLGQLVWVETMGSSGSDGCNSVYVDDFGNIFNLGHFNDSIDLEPGPIDSYYYSNGGADVFVTKLDRSINLSVEYVTACDTFFTPLENYFWTQSGKYFDTLLNSDGNDSVIIYHLDVNSSSYTYLTYEECDSLISPSGLYNWYESGTYYDTLVNDEGCDSILTIDLNITNWDNIECEIIDSFILVNITGVTYQWLDCWDNNSPIIGANNQFYAPTQEGSYAVEISNGICIDTSACISFLLVESDISLLNDSRVIFPNPTKDYIYIEDDASKSILSIRVFGCRGLCLQVQYDGNMNYLNVSDLDQGIYYIEINYINSSEVFRFVKL